MWHNDAILHALYQYCNTNIKKKKLAVTKPTKEEKGNLYSVVMISPETESVEQITLGKFHDLIQRKS